MAVVAGTHYEMIENPPTNMAWSYGGDQFCQIIMVLISWGVFGQQTSENRCPIESLQRLYTILHCATVLLYDWRHTHSCTFFDLNQTEQQHLWEKRWTIRSHNTKVNVHWRTTRIPTTYQQHSWCYRCGCVSLITIDTTYQYVKSARRQSFMYRQTRSAPSTNVLG